MANLKGNNLKEMMSKNDGEIHINDVIHWVNNHGYYMYDDSVKYDKESNNEFNAYRIQNVSEIDSKGASDGALLLFDSNGIIHSYNFLN